MKNYDAKSIDEYIAGADAEARPKLQELRELIRAAIPHAEESISYGVPFYKYYGQIAGFAAHKSHVGIWLPLMRLPIEDREALEAQGYRTAEKTIQIKFDQEVPAAMIKQYLTTQAAINKNSSKR